MHTERFVEDTPSVLDGAGERLEIETYAPAFFIAKIDHMHSLSHVNITKRKFID